MSPQVLKAHGLEPLKLGPKEVLSTIDLQFLWPSFENKLFLGNLVLIYF